MEIRKKEHLSGMKALFYLSFFLVSLNIQAQDSYNDRFGDSLSEITWHCYIAYLPSIHSERISLTATPKKLQADYRTIKWRKRFKRPVRKKIRMSKDDFVQLDSNFRELNRHFIPLDISEDDKQYLRQTLHDTTYLGDRIYKLSAEQLENYLQEDQITIDASVFEMDTLGFLSHGFVIDGAPFKFTYLTINKDSDTTIITYAGNLAGGDRYRELANYFRFYLLINSTHLFDRLPFETYFTRERLMHSLLRYLEGKEGLLDFKPLELKLGEEFSPIRE